MSMRISVSGVASFILLLVTAGWRPAPAAAQSGNTVTFYKDVLPILQKHCLSCHRPGQMAPITFLSYRQTRAWADAIRQVVGAAKMPPWSGAVASQQPMLSNREVTTLVQWVDEGAVAGDPRDAPPPAFEEEARLLVLRARTQRLGPQ